ncbi:MAG: hypothetical protein AAF655_03860, partial [Bacteroidota bacterium]
MVKYICYFLLISFQLMGSGVLPAQQLKAHLVVPQTNPQGERSLDMSRYPRFHVVLQNTGDFPLNIWKDWNSWGYYNLSLIFSSPDTSFKIQKKNPKTWDGDFADYWTILPDEHLVLEIDMRAGLWKGIPDLYGETLSGEISAVYENKPDALASEFGIWTGKLS